MKSDLQILSFLQGVKNNYAWINFMGPPGLQLEIYSDTRKLSERVSYIKYFELLDIDILAADLLAVDKLAG